MPQSVERQFRVPENGTMPDAWWRWLRDYLNLYAGREIEMKIGPPTRSPESNRFYWGYRIRPIWEAMVEAGIGRVEVTNPMTGELREAPLTMMAVHSYFKHKYLPVETWQIGDLSGTREPTTTKLDSTQFYDYMENIRNDNLTLALGVYLEDPPESFRNYTIHEAA